MAERVSYIPHSDNGDGEISIRPIDNGFIISYKYLLSTREAYVENMDKLKEWLMKFYRAGV